MTDTTTVVPPSAVDQVLLAALDTAKKAGNFVIEQTPDLIQQLLVYNIAANSLKLLISLATAAASAKLLLWGVKKMNKREYGSNDAEFPAMIFGTIGTVVSGWAALLYVLELTKLLLAPKIWLLEYAASLVR